MSDHLTPLEDARRERDEAQERALVAEQRLSTFTQRLSYAVVIVLAVLAMAGAGIVFAPEQVAGLIVGVP